MKGFILITAFAFFSPFVSADSSNTIFSSCLNLVVTMNGIDQQLRSSKRNHYSRSLKKEKRQLSRRYMKLGCTKYRAQIMRSLPRTL